MEKRFVMAFDGFVQREYKHTFAEIVKIFSRDVRNFMLYQYDCSVYELNDDDTIKRRVPDEELRT